MAKQEQPNWGLLVTEYELGKLEKIMKNARFQLRVIQEYPGVTKIIYNRLLQSFLEEHTWLFMSKNMKGPYNSFEEYLLWEREQMALGLRKRVKRRA